jgi:hypothetical protein
MMRRLAWVLATTVGAVAAGCAASGSDSQTHGPVYGVDDGGDDGAAPSPDAAGPGVDASTPSEAASPVDATTPPDVAAPPEAGDDAAEASVPTPDASDAAADSGADAPSRCLGFDAATDPFTGVDAVVGGAYVPDNGTVGAGQAVTINAWTLPAGIMTDVSIAYTANNFATPAILVAMPRDPGDSGAPGQDEWSAQIPGQPSGTQVVWYVVGHDACSPAPQYYSNLGANYHYKAQ